MKATEALLATKTKIKKLEKRNKWRISQGLKPKVVKCPQSDFCPVRYDSHSSTINLRAGTATLASLNGRQKINLLISDYHKPRSGYEVKSADLCIDRKHKMFLHVVVNVPEAIFPENSDVLGVDLGINRPAVTSDKQFFGEKRWKAIVERYDVLRQALIAKGTKSAKRHLKTLGRRINRFRTDCDHVLSKRIVESAPQGATIVFEDLTDIRGRVQNRKEHRKPMHSWSFDRLQMFTNYKAKIRGNRVGYTDPRYTSQKCSMCKHTEKGNRQTTAWFKCKKCGFQCNADLNASRNIRDNYKASKGNAAAGGLESLSLSFQHQASVRSTSLEARNMPPNSLGGK